MKKYSLFFYLQKNRLTMVVRWDCYQFVTRVGFVINPNKWDNDKQLCVRNSTHGTDKVSALVINREIERYTETAERIFATAFSENRVLSKLEFSELFSVAIGRKVAPKISVLDFWGVYDKFMQSESVKNSWSLSTLAKFKTIKSHLRAFDSDMEFAKITDSYLNDFLEYFTSRGYKNSTTAKDIKFVRWFLRWACNNGYYNGNCHETYKPRLKGSGDKEDVIYLTWSELLQVYDYQFATEQASLERVRDVFCFCCFSGLRYSDVSVLKKMDIYDDKIHIITRKTVDSLTIDLNDYSRAILAKYKDFVSPKGLALPVITNQRMNDTLKDVVRLAGVDSEVRKTYFVGSVRHEEVFKKWQVITTHTGRHTFIITALVLGIPLEVIMRFTGHAKYESVKPYLKIVDDLKRNEMQKFNSLRGF